MEHQENIFTAEQWAEYIQRVEALIESRRRGGTLLSTFDLIAGASLIFFFSENQNKMPAKWVFASVREGMLPDGLLETAQRLESRLKEIADTFDEIGELAESVASMSATVCDLRSQLKVVVREIRNTLNEATTTKEFAK